MPPSPAMALAVSTDIESLCNDITAFSLPTRLPDSTSLTNGGRTASETNRPSQFPDSAKKHTTVAAFSLIFDDVEERS
ncbi:hypothetical protein IEQ34_019225 [Dendrobium chrysotoxum]|uniref:Uncharacterized protein n=1 Tax=Dendrobium chrysotoxum TaxID=161865 RepID=A0AAV7G6T6_DENCH|nr:hypothetical protein IEQ34_019225 [Dendrobium chrysotoxum]